MIRPRLTEIDFGINNYLPLQLGQHTPSIEELKSDVDYSLITNQTLFDILSEFENEESQKTLQFFLQKAKECGRLKGFIDYCVVPLENKGSGKKFCTFLDSAINQMKQGFERILRAEGFEKTHLDYLDYQILYYDEFKEELDEKFKEPWSDVFKEFLTHPRYKSLLIDNLSWRTDLPENLQEFLKQYCRFMIGNGHQLQVNDYTGFNIFDRLAMQKNPNLFSSFLDTIDENIASIDISLIAKQNEYGCYPLNYLNPDIDLIRKVHTIILKNHLNGEDIYKMILPKFTPLENCKEKDIDFLKKFIDFCVENNFKMHEVSNIEAVKSLTFFEYVLAIGDKELTQKYLLSIDEDNLKKILESNQGNKFTTMQKLYDADCFEAFDIAIRCFSKDFLDFKTAKTPMERITMNSYLLEIFNIIVQRDDPKIYEQVFSNNPELAEAIENAQYDIFTIVAAGESPDKNFLKKSRNNFLLRKLKKPNYFVYKHLPAIDSSLDPYDFLKDLGDSDLIESNPISIFFMAGQDDKAKAKLDEFLKLDEFEIRKLLRTNKVNQADLLRVLCCCKDIDYIKSSIQTLDSIFGDLNALDQDNERGASLVSALNLENMEYAYLLLDRYNDDELSKSNIVNILKLTSESDPANLDFLQNFLKKISVKKLKESFKDDSCQLSSIHTNNPQVFAIIIDKIYENDRQLKMDDFFKKFFLSTHKISNYYKESSKSISLLFPLNSLLEFITRVEHIDDSGDNQIALKQAYKGYLRKFYDEGDLKLDPKEIKILVITYAEKFDECLTIGNKKFDDLVFSFAHQKGSALKYSRESILGNPLYYSYLTNNQTLFESSFSKLEDKDGFVDKIYDLVYNLNDYLSNSIISKSGLDENFESLGISSKSLMDFLVKYKTILHKYNNPGQQISHEDLQIEVIDEIKLKFEEKIQSQGSTKPLLISNLETYFALVSSKKLEVKIESEALRLKTKRSDKSRARLTHFDQFPKFSLKCEDILLQSFENESKSALSGIKNKNTGILNLYLQKKSSLEKELEVIDKFERIKLRKGEDEILFSQRKIENYRKKIEHLRDIKILEEIIYRNRAFDIQESFKQEALKRFREIVKIRISESVSIEACKIHEYQYKTTENLSTISAIESRLDQDYILEFDREKTQKEFELIRSELNKKAKECIDNFNKRSDDDFDFKEKEIQIKIKTHEEKIKQIESDKIKEAQKPDVIKLDVKKLDVIKLDDSIASDDVSIALPTKAPNTLKDLTQGDINELKNLLVGEIKEFNFDIKIIDASGQKDESLLIRKHDYLQDIQDYRVSFPKSYSELKGLFHENLQICLQQINSNSKITSSFQSNKQIRDLLYAFTAYLMKAEDSDEQVKKCFKRIISYSQEGTKEGVGHAKGADFDELLQMVAITNKMKKIFSDEPETYTKEFLQDSFRKIAKYESSEEISSKKDAELLDDLCKKMAELKDNSVLQKELNDFKNEVMNFIKKRADLLYRKINASKAMGGDNDAQTNEMFRFFSDNKINEEANIVRFGEFLSKINNPDLDENNFFKILQETEHKQSFQTLLDSLNFTALEPTSSFQDLKEKMSKKFDEVNEKYIARCLEKEQNKKIVR